MPILRIVVREAARRPVPPGAWGIPGGTDGYLLNDSAVLYAEPLTVFIGFVGTPPAGYQAPLVHIAQLAGARILPFRNIQLVRDN